MIRILVGYVGYGHCHGSLLCPAAVGASLRISAAAARRRKTWTPVELALTISLAPETADADRDVETEDEDLSKAERTVRSFAISANGSYAPGARLRQNRR